jgi:hypothetical protein
MHGKVFRPGPVTMMVGEPIPTKDLTVKDRDRLTQEVRDQIVAMLAGKPAPRAMAAAENRPS